MSEVLDTGIYCTDCGYFEPKEVDSECCIVCGCLADAHVRCEVISAKED